ncbi:hypothetical protein, partial [Micromonospora sp. NPDC050495]|uniref:hypothetical protein n=1 Tax=Micromonospora sp. NPDC050495 TaxID=3154936 RepID=UPI00340D11AA
PTDEERSRLIRGFLGSPEAARFGLDSVADTEPRSGRPTRIEVFYPALPILMELCSFHVWAGTGPWHTGES